MKTEKLKSEINRTQIRLDNIGVSGIHVFWNPDINKFTKEQITKNIIDIFNSYLDGNRIKLEPLGDSSSCIDKKLMHK